MTTRVSERRRKADLAQAAEAAGAETAPAVPVPNEVV